MGDHEIQTGSYIIIEEISFQKFGYLKIEAPDEEFDDETLSRRIMVISNSKIIGFGKVEDQDDEDGSDTQVDKDESEQPSCTIAMLNENMIKTSFTLKFFIEKNTN